MKDLKDYLLLSAILAIGFGTFWFFDFNRVAQVGVTLVMAAAYVLWGIVHHSFRKDLHWRIILEYLAVAAIASVVVIYLLLRA